MAKYKATIHKVLEDGTELEVMYVKDQPWYVAWHLAKFAKDLKRLQPVQPDPPPMEGQTELGVAA